MGISDRSSLNGEGLAYSQRHRANPAISGRHGRHCFFQSDQRIRTAHLCSISMALGHPASAATSRNGTAAIPLLPLEQRAARRAVCDVLSFAKNYFRNGCCEAFTLTRKPGCPFRARLFALVAKCRRLAYGHPTGHPRRTAYRTTPTQRHRPK